MEPSPISFRSDFRNYHHKFQSIGSYKDKQSIDKNYLMRSIEQLLYKNYLLSFRNQELEENVNDLRNLLTVTRQQHNQQIQQLHNKTIYFQEKANRYAKALKALNQKGGHLQKCALYWQQNL